MSEKNEVPAAPAGLWTRAKAILTKIGMSIGYAWAFVWLKGHDQDQPK